MKRLISLLCALCLLFSLSVAEAYCECQRIFEPSGNQYLSH